MREVALEQGRPDDLQRTVNLLKLNAQLRVNELETAGKLADEQEKYRAAVLDLARRRVDFENRLREAQGQGHAARMIEIAAQAEEFRTDLLAQGDPEADQKAEEFQGALEVRERFDAHIDQIDQELARLDRERADIRREVESGQTSELEGERQIAALEIARLPRLRAMAQAARELALASKDEKLVDQIDDLIGSLADIEVGVENVTNTMLSMSKAARDAIESGLVSALSQVGDRIKTLGEFWQAFVFDVLRGIQQIASAALAKELISLLPLPGVTKKAAGGEVHGPGTGTSDSVPALLSRGEFVVRERVVRQPGVLGALHRLNAGDVSLMVPQLAPGDLALIQRGMQQLPARDFDGESREYRKKYALGGLVGTESLSVSGAAPGGGAATVNGQVLVELGEGLEGRVIESRRGEKAVLRVIARNKRLLRDLLG